LDLLAREGYDPAYGARPLKRVIQKRIMDRLATELLKGTVQEGSRIRVDEDPPGELSLRPAGPRN
jgi:ATP-dependent Clp protease ATP-binding subunit ClpA